RGRGLCLKRWLFRSHFGFRHFGGFFSLSFGLGFGIGLRLGFGFGLRLRLRFRGLFVDFRLRFFGLRLSLFRDLCLSFSLFDSGFRLVYFFGLRLFSGL